MKYEPFPMSFGPAAAAIDLLAKVASSRSSFRLEAREVLERWRGALATPQQIEMVSINDDLEIDSDGCCVSASDKGFFIQTWTWVGYPDDYDNDDDEHDRAADRDADWQNEMKRRYP
jgi:hypothetical protein